MSRAQWWSQPVAAEGSTASEGIRRQLGKPRLDPLTVLVRETAQNTCDAALPGGGEIEFAVRLRRLSGRQLEAWREFLLPEPPGSRLGIAGAMDRSSLVMTIADRGTTGLGGPLRADETPRTGERPDFVNFIRNVGERKTVDLGGGSYGFGKGILYNLSRCHVVVADSVCNFRGRRQRRLIAAALGDGFTNDGRRYTGRHWLGIPDEDGHTRPLLDDEAEDMAARLGLPSFSHGSTGTTVAVVDVLLGQRSSDSDEIREPDEAAEFIASTMVWNLWPRMLRDRSDRLVCSVRRDGFATEVPDPESLNELAPFVRSYQQLSEPGGYSIPQRQARPTEIGRFAVAQGMAPVSPNRLLAAAAPFKGRAHHCARMRQADLVVNYIEGEAPADEMIQYGAVFRASSAADGYFAEAEPPTHDDWVSAGLQGTARGVVQLANRYVRQQLGDHASRSSAPKPSGAVPLGPLASRLAGLLATESTAAEAAVGDSRGGRSSGRSRTSGPRFCEPPILTNVDGRALIRAVVEFPHWPVAKVVKAQPRVVLDKGVEEVEVSSSCQGVLGWRSQPAQARHDGPALLLGRDSDRLWELWVHPPRDAVVRIDLQVEDVQE